MTMKDYNTERMTFGHFVSLLNTIKQELEVTLGEG